MKKTTAKPTAKASRKATTMAKDNTSANEKSSPTMATNAAAKDIPNTTATNIIKECFDPREPAFYVRILEIAAKSAMDHPDVMKGLKKCFHDATDGKLVVMTQDELDVITCKAK